MDIYKITPDSNSFRGISLIEDYGIDMLLKAGSKPGRIISNNEIHYEHTQEHLPDGDFPSLISYMPALSEKAYRCLCNDLAGISQEIVLYEKLSSKKLFAVNVLHSYRCVNVSKSQVDYYSCSGRIKNITKFFLIREEIKESFIFRTKEAPHLGVFVDERFKEIYLKNNLIGLIFQEVAY